jgi:hypothetical protein
MPTMTAGQQRERAKAEFDAFLADCPSRFLERDGLVTRTVTASVPVRVDYALTDLGQSLQDPIKLLKAWAEDHVPDVREAQERYDEEHAS